MKHTTVFLFFIAIFWAATAQQSEITLSRSDYKMQYGLPVVTNDSLLRMLHRGTVKTLFRKLKYRKGVAEIRHCTRVEDLCEYECRGEIDNGNHEFPASAIVFIYSEESYYIPINGGCNWDDIELGDSVCLTMTVYRDRRGHYEEKPYAEVTAIKRIRVEGEVDTLGRIFCFSGDTIVFTHKDVHWNWEQRSSFAATGDSSVEFVEFWPILQMSEAFCRQINRKDIHFVERYDRGNHRWRDIYVPQRKRNPDETQQVPACKLILEER